MRLLIGCGCGFILAVILVVAVVLGGAAVLHATQRPALPRPMNPFRPKPQPKPKPTPKPKPRPKPWERGRGPVGLKDKDSLVNGRIFDSECISADFPEGQWFKNKGSDVDGAGMCVTSSVEMISLYDGMEDFRGFRDWCAKEPGGCYPGKLEDQIKRYCEEKKIDVPRYVNFEGPDPEPLLKALDDCGMPFAHTYGWSPRYNQKIAHMVFSVKFGGKYAVVVDNNEIGGLEPSSGKIFEWMLCDEHIRRMKYGNDGAWVFAWLVPPPPPCPRVDE